MNNTQKQNSPSNESKFKTVTRQVIKTKDGKLNYVSLGLIGLIFLLLGSLTYYTVQKTSPKAIQDAVVNGLSDEAMEEAIQNAFLTGVEEYLNGDISKEEVKDRIMQLIADYLNSSSYFTDNQKAELQDIISQYLADIDIETLVSNNAENIEHVQNDLKKYMSQNAQTLQLLQQTLQTEIDNNMTYTQEQLDILNELNTNLSNLELKHFKNIEQYFSETIDRFEHLNSETQYVMNNGLEMWEANKEYKINTFVMYVTYTGRNETGTSPDLDFKGYRTTDIHMFQNLTGVNTDKNPVEDTTNWKEVSLGVAIQNIYNVTIGGETSAYSEWLNNHTTDADGTVIDQYVTYNNYLYQNISGTYDPDKTPEEDAANWKKLSTSDAIEKNFQTMLEDLQGQMAAYTEWLSNHKTDANGSVINQYVTYKNEVYQNISGEYNANLTPDEDTANWVKVSVFEAIQKNLEKMIADLQGNVSAYNDWLTNHIKNVDGSVIDQYVTYNSVTYQNITGEYDPSLTPDKDTTNWKEISAFEAIEKNYQTFIERLYSGIAGWEPTASYKPNSYVMYKNQLYRNLTGVNDPSMTPDKDMVNWEASSMVTVIQNTYNTFLAASGAKDYVAGDSHAAGDYVVYNNIMYKNVSDNADAMGGQPIPGVTDGDGTQSVWVAVSITDMIDANYQTFANAVGAQEYNNAKSYQAGDYVLHNGKLYRAKDATSGSFNSGAWEEVAITTQIESLNKDVEELKVQTSTTLEALDKNLTELIKDNKSLTEKQKEDMLAVLQATKEAGDASEEALANLKTQLEAIMASESNENEKERAKITEQLEALENNTASYMYDYELRIDRLEQQSREGTTDFSFGVDPSSGAYGYYVDRKYNPATHQYEGGTFKPF